MTTPQVQNDPIINLPFLYINGMVISNDGVNSAAIDISAGQCRDSNDVMDICLGIPNVEGVLLENAPAVVNGLLNGVNGLDAGSLATFTLYAVYAIGDSRNYLPSAGILSLASNALPLIPFGYDSYRLIGYAATGASASFPAFFISGNNNNRIYNYGVPRAFASGLNATTATAVSLTQLVPNVENTPVSLLCDFTANAAADVFKLYLYGQSGNILQFNAPVAGSVTHLVVQAFLASKLNAGVPSVAYSVTSSSDALAMSIVSFQFYI